MPAPLIAPSAPVTVSLCQVLVGTDKAANLATAKSAVSAAVAAGAQLVVLPECFNCPYTTDAFPEYAEPIPEPVAAAADAAPGSACATPALCVDAVASPSVAEIAGWAREFGVYVVAGSIPERGPNNEIFNTSTVFSPSGALLAKHRKAHLFDIDIPGRMTFRESDSLTGGSAITTVDLDFSLVETYAAAAAKAAAGSEATGAGAGAVLRMGLGICYDIRFTEYAQVCAARGAALLLYPGAFNTVTGPAHWELLQRAHAVGQQCFVAACSPARNPESKYQAWGHSSVVDPWGTVVATTEHDAATVTATVDFARVREVRAQIPITVQKRGDLYAVVDKTA